MPKDSKIREEEVPEFEGEAPNFEARKEEEVIPIEDQHDQPQEQPQGIFDDEEPEERSVKGPQRVRMKFQKKRSVKGPQRVGQKLKKEKKKRKGGVRDASFSSCSSYVLKEGNRSHSCGDGHDASSSS